MLNNIKYILYKNHIPRNQWRFLNYKKNFDFDSYHNIIIEFDLR